MKRSTFKSLILSIILVLTQFQGRAIPYFEFFKTPIVALNGEGWIFYHGHTYDEVCKNNLQGVPIRVPGNWNYLKFPEKGFGTYVIRFVHDQPPNAQLMLKLQAVGTNYISFVNGKRMFCSGVFSTSAEYAKPDFIPSRITFDATRDTMEIAIQVSNYHYREGGLWYTPTLGLFDSMEKKYAREMFLDAFLCGSLFVLFCYFIAFYFIKKEDKTSLLFALLCLSSVIRIASTGNILFRQLEWPLPWELLVKFEYLSLVLMLLLGVLYLNSLFSSDSNQKGIKMISWIQMGVFVVFLFLPVKWTSYLLPYYLYFCGFLLVYLLNLVIKVIYKKRRFAWMVGGTYLLVFAAGLNDILYSQAIIKTFYLMPYGIFLFAINQAMALTHIFSQAFNEVENLSQKLKTININQKEIIQERTALLNLQAHELQRSNQIKDKVFSIIAHDLRTPIKSLSTVLAWVAEDDLSYEALKKSLNGISKNVDTLNLTLENLLQWSRSQLNGVRSKPELIDIRKPLLEVMELYKFQLAEKGITFNNTIQDRFAVFVDDHHLNLLLRNLISNAIKFSNPGGTIEVNARHDQEKYTLICIKDKGVGMSQEAINKVFSPVEHYTTYGTGNEKGTGLGLLLCKEYIELGGGKIWLESEVNNGTRVCFTLPNFSN